MDALQTRGFGSKLYRWFRDPQVSTLKKLTGFAALAYLVLPLDAVPDVVPFIGWLDDVGVLGAAGAYITREVRKHARG